ncbi:LADA_0B02322g1_1 [Lachancea dasiensis]|uniref:LADA_0B02322g1_1 n=1 Tax=Lachancea dasiensis TaxID=1072105 RepID=A0A1G4IS60_9SACH|nr:LADA_0B02322g1_1 [Lachancea dasiensis]
MNKFVQRGLFLHIYPCILVVGMVVNMIVDRSQLDHQRETYYLLSSKNWANQIFAYRGNLIWTALYIFLACFQLYIRLSRADSLPVDVRSAQERHLAKTVKPYIVKLGLKNLILMVIFLFIDRVFVWTGGSCSTSDTKSAETCRRQHGQWAHGFDISGHFCFLTTVSLLLWLELRAAYRYMAVNEISSTRIWACIQAGVGAVVLVWAFLLCVTAIYYHTFAEKLLGLLVGYICPAILYWVIPCHQKLNSVFY